jgi:hypothetical protein
MACLFLSGVVYSRENIMDNAHNIGRNVNYKNNFLFYYRERNDTSSGLIIINYIFLLFILKIIIFKKIKNIE